MFKDVEALREQIRSFGLNRLEEKIIQLAQPCIYMIREAVDDERLPVGSSKLGGLPDLPANFQWPYYNDVPLTFIGQFKFSEIAPYDPEGILPNQGILYYFIETDDMIFGTYKQRNAWRVFYLSDENTPLIRTSHPTHQGEFRLIRALRSHRIEYQRCLSIPTIFESEASDYGLDFLDDRDVNNPYYDWSTPTELAAYFNLEKVVHPAPMHYWLGHPQLWQGSIEEEVVINSQQLERQKFPDQLYRFTDEQIDYIKTETEKWQFLFQLHTDDSLDVIWGETGSLYICIPKESLALLRFEDCWTIMQCT
ncbi:MAG: DUF1963 domain-containing protein [Anaerolineaceae bacterium]|nr:DUF1963 domain-containing protein [Anaerolineaceae bacterium]